MRSLQNSSFNLPISNTFLYLYGMKQKISSPSFADIFLSQRKVKQTFFSQINTVIDWAPIRAIIEVAYTKGYNSTGRPGYDCLVLFKIELLRTWYGLSDVEVEDQVNDRLSFSRFAGLGLEDTVPDSTTVYRFRNVLVEADLYDTLLNEFNRQLEVKGVIVKHDAIVDTSITPPVVPADVRAMRSLRIEKMMKTRRLRKKQWSKKSSSLMWMRKLVG